MWWARGLPNEQGVLRVDHRVSKAFPQNTMHTPKKPDQTYDSTVGAGFALR